MKIAILTGGGDVSPLNALIFAARERAVALKHKFVGFVNGWQGVLEKKLISLDNVDDFSDIGGTSLKSSRVNLLAEKDGINTAVTALKNLGIDGLIIVGGDDTLTNAYYMSEIPCVLISKTIDNDVGYISGEKIENYFTLGYPTAAGRIISYVSLEEGIRTTAYSHERIMILESMGMYAGWLALASGLAEPDFIIIPEFPLDYDEFCKKLIQSYNSQKHAVIVIAEGARLKDGGYISAEFNEQDDFGHPRFGGSSLVLRDALKKDLRHFFDTRNINAVNPSYLYRSGKPNDLDLSTAQKMGAMAVILLSETSEKLSGQPTLLATNCKNGIIDIKALPLSSFPKTKDGHFPKRFVDSDFYDSENYQITSFGKKYLEPIVDDKLKNRLVANKREYYGIHRTLS